MSSAPRTRPHSLKRLLGVSTRFGSGSCSAVDLVNDLAHTGRSQVRQNRPQTIPPDASPGLHRAALEYPRK